MKNLFIVTAVIESTAAFGLMINPSAMVMHLTRFSLQGNLETAAVRCSGVLLLVLAVGCWSMRPHTHCAKAMHLVMVLLAYNGFATLFLSIAYDSTRPLAGGVGILLHAAMVIWCLFCVFPCIRNKN
jgi:hypothetical protein